MNNKYSSNVQTKGIAYFIAFLVWAASTGYGLSQSVAEAASRYHTSEFVIRLIQVAISLPLLFIYLAVVFAASAFQSYAANIEGSREHKGYKYITLGLYITLTSFLASGLLGIVGNKLEGTALNNFIVARNAVTITLGLLAYLLLFRASMKLVSTLKTTEHIKKYTLFALVFVTALAAVYATLVFQNPYRTASNSDLIRPTYALPDSLIVTTVVLPYVITWALGILTVMNLAYYSKHVNGIIYKELFKNLARGFGLVIALTISLQMTGQFSEMFSKAGLQAILAFIGVIFLVLVAGYWLVGRAASKLNQVESV